MDEAKELFLDYKIANMTLEEKIGQLIYMDYRSISEMDVHLEDILSTYNPGGFILFKSNVTDFNQTQKFISDIKDIPNIPIFIGTDQEGGRVQRIKNIEHFTTMPPMMEIGKTMNPNYAYEIGKQMGEELHYLGVNMDMAPVLDVFSNPQNTVIGDRAFGTDAKAVSEMGIAFSEGLRDAKIIPVVKHFPGHGNTAVDSHINLPVMNKNYDELQKSELIPFVNAIKNNAEAIMLGHLAVPRVTNDNIPASMSPIIIKDILRKDLDFNGILMTDSVKMKALTKYFTEEEIYLRVIRSGNDLILMPNDVVKAFETIRVAVLEGQISEQEIDISVRRILSVKYNYGLFNEEIFNQSNNLLR